MGPVGQFVYTYRGKKVNPNHIDPSILNQLDCTERPSMSYNALTRTVTPNKLNQEELYHVTTGRNQRPIYPEYTQQDIQQYYSQTNKPKPTYNPDYDIDEYEFEEPEYKFEEYEPDEF
jgi:hypothetical protein